jgi:LruC domain-containing protein
MKTRLIFPKIVVAFALIAIFQSCNKSKDDPIDPKPITSIEDLIVSDNFNYQMVQSFNMRIVTKDIYDNPIANAIVYVYRSFDEESYEGDLMLTGKTNFEGVWETKYPLDFVTSKLYLVTRYVGLPTVTEVEIKNSSFDVTIGGLSNAGSQLKGLYNMKSIDARYQYLCAYNNAGVPACLISPRDVIDAEMLADINAALPERAPVPQYHPEYLAESNQTDTRIIEDADVWVTFVHEGAGYKNTIAFYTYDLNNPPATKAEIDTIQIIFPNLSYYNSGGGLYSGDKIKIGTFPAGTGIGWVIIANGYTGSTVNTNLVHFYSNPDFNPETNPTKQQHNVLMYDAVRQLYLIGFEDISRTSSGCDNDFNDAIYYVTSNPVEAIDNSNMPFVDPNLIDSDGDGVFDVMDDYPTDNERAFNNYFPGRTQTGSLAFEDLWPLKGDYDFNDLVMSYQINQVTNANNLIKDIVSTFTIEAIGAGYKNGFGFQLGVPSSFVQSVTGYNHKENIVSLNQNNTEAGNNKATIIPFDNTYNLFNTISSGFVNTRPEMSYVQPESITINTTFNTAQTLDAVGLPPYNPFIFINKERGKEVHLPGYVPTQLANTLYFGTGDDDTNLATGKYYKSKTNLPWGMHLPNSFAYPQEKKVILEAHLIFGQWVNSSGFSYMDWYEDKQGYRNTNVIYQKGNY